MLHFRSHHRTMAPPARQEVGTGVTTTKSGNRKTPRDMLRQDRRAGAAFCGPALWETWCCTVSVRPVSTGATFSRDTRIYTLSSSFCVDAAGAAGSVPVTTAFEAVLYPLAPAAGVADTGAAPVALLRVC